MVESVAITIRRQVLDVELQGTEPDGLALLRRLPDVCADVLRPTLESAFARVDPGDAYLYVERLAIDLADVSLDRLEAELVEAVRREVADWFRRHPPSAAMVAGGIAASGDVQLRSVADTVEEGLVEFLRTGRLPWFFRVPEGSRLEDLVLDASGAAVETRALSSATRGRLRNVLALPHARARLVRQFTPNFVVTVLLGAAPELTASVEELQGTLHEIDRSSPAGDAFVRHLWDAVIDAASAGTQRSAGELARTAWRGLAATGREDRGLSAMLERHWPGVTEPPDTRAAGEPIEARSPSPSPSLAPSPSPLPPAVELGVETEALVVDNAGVVLLHPFLPRFFEGLEVAAEDALVDANRAVCLLHHLATGELTAPEHQLTLAKVLCSVPLDEPVDADVGLTTAETEEAIALLNAVIGHWEALRGTSPDGLRGEFLTRPGSLAVDADGDWLLRVETRTVDILVDQLPWGISLVKLPWMGRLLRVAWR